MNTTALFIMLSSEISVTLFLASVLYRIFKARGDKSKQNHSQNSA